MRSFAPLPVSPANLALSVSSLRISLFHPSLFHYSPTSLVPISHLPYLLPSSVSRKIFVCHSCENCRGVGVFFPFWKTLRAYGDENSYFIQVLSFHIVAHSLACALFGTRKNSTLFFSTASALFTPKHRGWGYPLVPPHPPHSTQGYSCWLRIGLAPPHFRRTLVLR